jgi:hypothetical protein
MRIHLILYAFPWPGGTRHGTQDKSGRFRTLAALGEGPGKKFLASIQRFSASNVPLAGMNRHQVIHRERISHKISKTLGKGSKGVIKSSIWFTSVILTIPRLIRSQILMFENRKLTVVFAHGTTHSIHFNPPDPCKPADSCTKINKNKKTKYKPRR